ncbi:sulfotransferase family protein [Nonomuraea glycinis]|jgi:hypothetical protein|uniref:sulfotransferase family protein n=1 Tax=Nonomuraea glycinis TaxID=2047744 RepID=UPI002E11D525|nr:sulfotransferase [Nonomuraea glycinis]
MSLTRQPVFILAPARSYTTVSSALLAGHDELFVFPEMVGFNGRVIAELLSAADGTGPHSTYYSTQLSGVARAVAEVEFGDQRPASIRRAHRWLSGRSSWSTAEVLGYLLHRVQPLIGVEKSPDTVRSDEALSRCRTAYPGARLLHLTRHPTSALRSLTTHFGALTARSDRQTAITAALTWYTAHRRIMGATRTLPTRQVLRLRAEDLVGEPLRWLPVVLDWLGLPYDDEVLRRMIETDRWCFAGTGADHSLHGGDWKFLRSPALRPIATPGPVTFAAEWDLPVKMQRVMSELAGELGYE